MKTTKVADVLPEGWRPTGLKDHYRYKNYLVVIRQKGRIEMIASSLDKTLSVEGRNLERAVRKMEMKMESNL